MSTVQLPDPATSNRPAPTSRTEPTGRTDPVVLPVPDGRPAPICRELLVTVPASQPPLDLEFAELMDQPQPRPAVGLTPASAWQCLPAPGLPDPAAWGSSLAQAIVETLQGRRAIGQLTRWADERVIAAISLQARRQRGSRQPPRPAMCCSVRVQLPTPDSAEVCVRVGQAGRSLALALRLEACHGRWLCTALDLGPAPVG